MQKITSVVLFCLLSIFAFDVAAQPMSVHLAPPNSNGTTQNRAPNGFSTHSFLRASELVLASELTYIPAGTTLTSIGFTTTAGASVTVPGTMTVYIMNTNDATFNLGTNWSTITSSMTQVYSGAYTVPNNATTIDLPLTTPFTYTGGAVYVAWDYSSTGPFATGTAATYAANHLGLTNGCVSAASGSSAPTTLVPSNFRPCLRFGFPNPFTNELSVENVKTPASLAVSAGPHMVQATIRNNSNATVNNVNVNLNITGVNTFTDMQTVASIASGSTATVSFANWTPASLGNNTVTVDVPTDQYNPNNARAFNQLMTCNNLGSGDPTQTYTSSVGFGTSSGMLLARFNTQITTTVTGSRMAISTNTPSGGNAIYMALTDASGTIQGMTNTVTIVPSMYGTTQTFSFVPPITIPAGTWHIGMAQPANTITAYHPLGAYPTSFIPPGVFYTSSLAGGSVSPLTQNVGMMNLEAIFSGTCMVTHSGELDNDGINVLVYPNPSSDKINIKLGSVSGKAYAEIYNAIGQLVMSGVEIHGTQTTEFNISSLSKGVYIVRITNGKDVTNTKIIVDK